MLEEKDGAKSDFVAYLGIKNHERINQLLILPRVKEFFKAKNISHYKPIQEQACISDLDFKKSNFPEFFPYFYDFIVDDIYKKEGKVEAVVKYCITLDETNCSKTCDKTRIRYDEFLLYKEPVFYFIYIDIKDIFDCLRSNKCY